MRKLLSPTAAAIDTSAAPPADTAASIKLRIPDAESGLLYAPTVDAAPSPRSKKHRIKPIKHPLDPTETARRREIHSQLAKLGFMIVMTFVVFLLELFYGYMSNSVALIADSFHMLSDVLALSVALACILIANRRSKTNTFGWVRAEVVGALVNGVFLLALCFSIFIESVERLLEPHELKEPRNVLIVGIVGLIVNVVGMFLFHGHSHHHSHGGGSDEEKSDAIGESTYLATSHQDGAMALADLKGSEKNGTTALLRRKSHPDDDDGFARSPKTETNKNASQMNMKGVYLHIVTDFIGSVIVIVTASISIWFPELSAVKLYLDPLLSMIMVLLIMSSTIPLVHETALILLQTTPTDVDLNALERQLMHVPGVVAVHEFHVWRLVGVRIIATVHIRFQTLDHYLRAAERIRDIFHDHKVHSVTVQPEFSEMTEKERSDSECVLKCEPEDCKIASCCYIQQQLGANPSAVITDNNNETRPSASVSTVSATSTSATSSSASSEQRVPEA